MDGTPGISQCPLAPGQSQTYLFQATEYGISWYHSHWQSQYGDGLLGPIRINGPSSANYDHELGVLPLTDWYTNVTSAQVQDLWFDALQKSLAGPFPQAVLINGTNGVFNGDYLSSTVENGSTYRLGLVNTASEAMFRVSIDNHTMQIISADFTPVIPITVDSITIGIGQRYDIIITADQPVDNYWLRVENVVGCSTGIAGPQSALSILHYNGASDTIPDSKSHVLPNSTLVCELPGPFTPYAQTAGGSKSGFEESYKNLSAGAVFPGQSTTGDQLIFWAINYTHIRVNWEEPTLQSASKGNTSFPTLENAVVLPQLGKWTYWVMQEFGPPAVWFWHPIHLHGHQFSVLGTGLGNFSLENDLDRLTFDNAMRRDTEMLPAGGWMAVAVETDNPGAWLFHCHISVHLAEGFGYQFIEIPDQIPAPSSADIQLCQQWQRYDATALVHQEESGL